MKVKMDNTWSGVVCCLLGFYDLLERGNAMEEAQGNCLNLVKCYVPHPQVIVAWPFLYSRNIKKSLVLQQYLTNVLISVCFFFAFLATRRWRYVGRGARPVWCGWTTPLRGGALFFMARGEIEVKRLKFLDSESGLVSPCE